MRTFLILSLLAIATCTFGQRQNVVIKENYALTSSDTTFYITTTDSYTWGITVKWSGVGGGTNAVYTVRVSRDKTNWIDYAGSLTSTMAAASGLVSFEDDRTAFPYIGLRIQRNTASGGDIDVYITLDTNQ